jgi:hypothetical protein
MVNFQRFISDGVLMNLANSAVMPTTCLLLSMHRFGKEFAAKQD